MNRRLTHGPSEFYIMKKATLPKKQMEIAYDEAGSGPPLVLLHGFPLDKSMWQPQLAGLSSTHRVLAPDYPGFGDSSPTTEGFTVESLAEEVADFLDATGITGAVTLAGLSMGGYIALAFARQHPERLRALILADTRAEPDDETAKASRDVMAELARQEGAGAVIGKMLPKLVAEPSSTAAETVKQIGTRQQVESIVHALQALKERPDATPGLAAITVPTLIIVGEKDAITPPAMAETLASHIIGSTLVKIPGAGHLSNLEAPDAFNNAVRTFLKGERGS